MKVWERRNMRRTKKKGCSTVILLQMTHIRKSIGICLLILYPTGDTAVDVSILVNSTLKEKTRSKLLALRARRIWTVIWIQGSPTIWLSTWSCAPRADQLRSELTFPKMTKQENFTNEFRSAKNSGRPPGRKEQPNLGRRNLSYLT